MQRYKSNSEQETKKIAEDFAKHTKASVFALTGELGAGKTIFVQGFAKGLGIQDKIISPTFVLIRQHKIPRTRGAYGTKKVLYHIDLYRLDDATNFKHLGLQEIWSDPNNIVLIEWPEKLNELPEEATKISIQKENYNKRTITIY